MIERIYALSYYHHQIGSMNYYPLLGLGHETTVCAVYLSIFLQNKTYMLILSFKRNNFIVFVSNKKYG